MSARPSIRFNSANSFKRELKFRILMKLESGFPNRFRYL